MFVSQFVSIAGQEFPDTPQVSQTAKAEETICGGDFGERLPKKGLVLNLNLEAPPARPNLM